MQQSDYMVTTHNAYVYKEERKKASSHDGIQCMDELPRAQSGLLSLGPLQQQIQFRTRLQPSAWSLVECVRILSLQTVLILSLEKLTELQHIKTEAYINRYLGLQTILLYYSI